MRLQNECPTNPTPIDSSLNFPPNSFRFPETPQTVWRILSFELEIFDRTFWLVGFKYGKYVLEIWAFQYSRLWQGIYDLEGQWPDATYGSYLKVLAVCLFICFPLTIALAHQFSLSNKFPHRWTPLHLAYTSRPTKNTVLFSLKYCFDPIVILTAEKYVSYELLNSQRRRMIMKRSQDVEMVGNKSSEGCTDFGAGSRIYAPDLEKMKTWQAPKEEKIHW